MLSVNMLLESPNKHMQQQLQLQHISKATVPFFSLTIKLKSGFYSMRIFDGIK